MIWDKIAFTAVADKTHPYPRIRNEISLCSAESQLEVVHGLVGVKDGVLECIGEETVHQGAERYAVFPTWGKVLDVYALFQTSDIFS